MEYDSHTILNIRHILRACLLGIPRNLTKSRPLVFEMGTLIILLTVQQPLLSGRYQGRALTIRESSVFSVVRRVHHRVRLAPASALQRGGRELIRTS